MYCPPWLPLQTEWLAWFRPVRDRLLPSGSFFAFLGTCSLCLVVLTMRAVHWGWQDREWRCPASGCLEWLYQPWSNFLVNFLLPEKNKWLWLSHSDGCYRLNCVPPEFIGWSLTPWYLKMWLFGDKAFKEINKVKMKLLDLIQSDCVLIRRDIRTQERRQG